jgi:sulfhydrogenase subunit beta (sulfur reductase)
MNKAFILDKNYLSYLLRQIRKKMSLIAPLRSGNGDVVLKTVENIHEIELNCPASIPSIKEFLFPQKEDMFRFSEGAVDILKNNTKRLIFGVRSCDISAITLLDRFFGEKFIDGYYMSRRENTIFMSLVCNNPDPTCFCLRLGTGPFLKSNFDIQLTDLGDRYMVETDSKNGVNLIKDYYYLFSKPKKSDYEDQYEIILSSRSKFEKRINLENARQTILSGKISDRFWDWVARRCFECGGCVYECPLCTCFNVLDRVESDSNGVRFRIWDACMFKGFTRMAGNMYPSENKGARIKQWFFHKLIYYPDHFGKFGCVGCGRCTITCPGHIDMATIADRIDIGDRRRR